MKAALCCARRVRWLTAAAVVLAIPATAQPDPGFRTYFTGDPQCARTSEPTPGLLLMGGGNWSNDAIEWFLDRAGRGRIVVLRASGGASLGDELFNKFGGTACVETIVFNSRDAADDPEVLERIKSADGIFIAGGDQSNYVRYWKGTPVAEALEQHVADGRPIGGTSAGLAILGSISYGALDGGSIRSDDALSNPTGPEMTMVRNFLHIPLMDDIVTDTHFNNRDRLGRLIAFVARARLDGYRRTVGLGIDEQGALTVDADGNARFHGPPGTYAWLVLPQKGVPRVKYGKPLDWKNIRVRGVAPGGTLDVSLMHAREPDFSSIVSIEKGKLVNN